VSVCRIQASDCDKRDEDCKSGVTVAPGKMEDLFHVDPTNENRFNIEVSSPWEAGREGRLE